MRGDVDSNNGILESETLGKTSSEFRYFCKGTGGDMATIVCG